MSAGFGSMHLQFLWGRLSSVVRNCRYLPSTLTACGKFVPFLAWLKSVPSCRLYSEDREAFARNAGTDKL
ncbi:hypothetical protein FIBSPDRAFT_861160 [Athelia psychrophila]|uniref:Uncharacterized protein n=1 Tax=Athelia psychrophila TaxID=1759441 RepID=A0A166JLF8_9AGAM|nr:hypothetical protein FIBSPDRAFT_861160 [Fibularhizoctonia sp. CBS 109695]